MSNFGELFAKTLVEPILEETGKVLADKLHNAIDGGIERKREIFSEGNNQKFNPNERIENNPQKELTEISKETDLSYKQFNPNERLDSEYIQKSADVKNNNVSERETFNPNDRIESLDKDRLINDYKNDVKCRSECPNTISDESFRSDKYEKISPEQNAVKREEFDDIKTDLKTQWSAANHQEWPKYKEDVYSDKGNLIRKAGMDYDAHHIQPLSMGGKNEASNITPLHAKEHYDSQGVHSSGSPYSKLEKILGA